MSLAELIASTPSMRAVFAPRATVQALLDVEAALAKAGAATNFLRQKPPLPSPPPVTPP